MQLIDSRGDRYRPWLCPFPSKSRERFRGGRGIRSVCTGCVLSGDEPAKMFCAFQEGNKENVHIYSNIIV